MLLHGIQFSHDKIGYSHFTQSHSAWNPIFQPKSMQLLVLSLLQDPHQDVMPQEPALKLILSERILSFFNIFQTQKTFNYILYCFGFTVVNIIIERKSIKNLEENVQA